MKHCGAAKRNDGTSHMIKHQSLVHSLEQPEFMFKVVSYCRTPLNIQVRKTGRICRRAGASSNWNSKFEFNRCYIPRLIIEKEEEGAKVRRHRQEEQESKDIQESPDKDVIS